MRRRNTAAGPSFGTTARHWTKCCSERSQSRARYAARPSANKPRSSQYLYNGTALTVAMTNTGVFPARKADVTQRQERTKLALTRWRRNLV